MHATVVVAISVFVLVSFWVNFGLIVGIRLSQTQVQTLDT